MAKPRPTGMTTEEVFAEIDWLLGGQVSPALACEQIATTPGAVANLAYRNGRPDLAEIFAAEAGRDRRRNENGN